MKRLTDLLNSRKRVTHTETPSFISDSEFQWRERQFNLSFTYRFNQKKQRQRDLETLLQRYQNVKSELETQQNLERIRMDRYAGQTAETMGIAGHKNKENDRRR